MKRHPEYLGKYTTERYHRDCMFFTNVTTRHACVRTTYFLELMPTTCMTWWSRVAPVDGWLKSPTVLKGMSIHPKIPMCVPVDTETAASVIGCGFAIFAAPVPPSPQEGRREHANHRKSGEKIS